MPFVKGHSGNPHGRPKRGDSLAEQIRGALTKADRAKLFAQMKMLACEPHGDPHARVKAAEWLAKHGWPEEGRPSQGKTTVQTSGGTVMVVHEHLGGDGA